jgi:hypothetical protein
LIAITIRKIIGTSLKIVLILLLAASVFVLINSSLDIYNNFAYDKAILKDTPHGWTPFLQNPQDWGSANGIVLSGEFVYVVDWLSAYNNRVAFARVKSKLKEGYINRDLLVETNVNLKPIISVFFLSIIFAYTFKKLYFKFST